VPLASGTRLGVYEVLSLLGSGGMGEVYQAKDTRLKRDVALKLLPDSFAHDADRLARFQREAELLATLNHPNIAGIYGLEESNGVRALVLELVDGPTLADRIAKGPIPVDEALTIARQIADALGAAHERSVIHRDLKPANIKVTPDGTVKVLDFGLAKLAEASATSGVVALSHSPTITTPAVTGVGTILGTAAYMSPEQARGKPVDKRADIWAFGCVLYEMLTGRRLFDGETVSDTLAAVLTKEPEWVLVPSKARPLVRRCLQKDPRNRARDIGEAMAWADSAPEPSSAPSGRRWMWPGIAALSAAAAVWFAIAAFRATAPAPGATVRFQLRPPDNVNLAVGRNFAMSPDARSLAFSAAGPDGVYRVWIRALDSLDARPLAGTETSRGSLLVWSPDSQQLAFVGEQKLKKVAAEGGPPQTVCDIDIAQLAVGGSWNRDGVIIFGASSGGLTRASAAGGPCSALTTLNPFEVQHTFPSFLPDGRHFLYVILSFGGSTPTSDLYVGSLDDTPASQKRTKVVSTRYSSQYVPALRGGGRLLFVRDRTLLAQPFDPQRLALSGDPEPVADQIGTLFADAYFSASDSGALVYRTSASERYQLTLFDRHGQAIGTAGVPLFLQGVALSPDGTRAIYQELGLGTTRVLDLARGTTTPLFAPALGAVWSPDGKRVAFASFPPGLYQQLATGAKDPERLLKSQDNSLPLDWSRDGRFLLYRSDNPKTRADLWALPLDGDKKPFPIVQTVADEPDARFSPDGRWIAYTSDESGKYEVYVRPFTPPSPGGGSSPAGIWTISKGGGNSAPRWRADGKALWYHTTDNKIMAVDVTTMPTFQAGEARVLFQQPGGVIAADTNGERFLLAVPAGEATQAPFTVVLNWQAALKK
jgi:Tol biopolymer transport system component